MFVRLPIAFLTCFCLQAKAVEFYRLEQHPAIKNPMWMKDSVQVQISPRGQRLFTENLTLLLSNLGVVINENYFPEFNYVSEKPININKLAKEKPKEFAMLMQVRQFFRQYLKGIEFKDFKPSVRLGPSDYIAQIEKLSMIADEELMKQLGKSEGAIFAIEVTISQLVANSDLVRAKDLDNPWLGEVGVKNPSIKIGTRQNPLKARMPFYVRVTREGGLFFEALKIEENLDLVPIEVKYGKLLLPEFEFKVSGQKQTYKVSLDDKEFGKIVDQNLPEALKLVRQYVRTYLQDEFPKMLNEHVQTALKNELEQIQNIPVAGSKPNDLRPPFSVGMKLSDVDLKDSFMIVKLDTFVEDTSLSAATPFWEKSGARGAPVFNHLDPKLYDIGVAIDRALFNRLVQLSFNRKNFSGMETCPGNPPIELANPPGIDFIKTNKPANDLETPMVMYIDALVKAPGDQTGSFFDPLREKVRLKFKYQVILKPMAPGSTKLGIYSSKIDVNSLQVDDSSLTWLGRLVKSKVVSEIAKALSKDADCGNNSALAEFELINSLWGIPVEFVKLQMDPQGQLMMYMNYKNLSSPK